MSTIAFIGLGNMGGPMAGNLVKAGHKVSAFDLSQASKDAAAALGVGIAASAKEAVADAEIVVTDVVDHPLSVARQVGADETIRIDRLPEGAPLSPATGEFDVAFEVSGSSQALATCLQSVRRGGIVVQVGTLPADGVQLPANQIMARELDLRGSFRFGNVFELAVGAIADRRVDVRPLISGAWPLKQAATAIETARDKTRSMKVQLTIQS